MPIRVIRLKRSIYAIRKKTQWSHYRDRSLQLTGDSKLRVADRIFPLIIIDLEL